MKAMSKDPDEGLDYILDLTAPLTLDGDTITSATVEVPTPDTGVIVLDADTFDAMTVTAWLSGGTAGVDYPVIFTAITAGGRVYQRTLEIRVRNR